MNTIQVPSLFPQTLIRQSRMYETTPKFRGLILPVESSARAAFYRGLPFVGAVVCEASRVWRKKNLDIVLPLALQTLREQAVRLAKVPTEKFAEETTQAIKAQITKAFGETTWPVQMESAPANISRQEPVVMVADADAVSRFVYCQELRKAGFDPRPVENGAEALLMASFWRPELILLDLEMPLVDGIEACTWLKESKLAGKSPIVFLSTENSEPTTASGIAAGGADFITKPINRQTFLSSVRAHLKISRWEATPVSTTTTLPATPLLVNEERVVSVVSADRNVAPAVLPLSMTDRPAAGRDLASLLRMVTWIFAPYAARKKVTLRISAPESGLWAVCDEIRIQRVLENLLSNAINFAPTCTTVTVAARLDKDRVCIWVDDEGPGVPLLEQSELFSGQATDRKSSSDSEVDYESGLVICGKIIAEQGGEIFMQNLREGGSHFEFWLPARTQPKVTAAMALADKPAKGSVAEFTATAVEETAKHELHLGEVA